MSETIIQAKFPDAPSGHTSKRGRTMSETNKVTITYGNRIAVEFGPDRPKIALSQDMIAEVARSIRVPASLQAPGRGSPQERLLLIALLDLDQDTVARIDGNAEAMKISFAEALTAEITG